MRALKAENLETILSQGRWDRAEAVFAQLDPSVASDVFLSLPHEEQRFLFRRLPIEVAAKLVPAFPYYDGFVLLHSLPVPKMIAVLSKMNPVERLDFIDRLPENAWQQITNELKIAESASSSREVIGDLSRAGERPIIEARRIEKGFRRPGGAYIQVIEPTSLSIEQGIIIALLGPSGSGKSTLLRILSGLTPPSTGAVLWDGKPLGGSMPNTAIVFQSFALFPWLTVLENVEVPLLARGIPLTERRNRSLKVLDSVGLKGFEAAFPKELSGGMKQRVGFARALAIEPEVLFMDEPFSALDVLTAENLRGELIELWLGKKIPTKSILVVTHNIEEAVQLADRIIVLSRIPAKIRADFRVPLQHPRERRSAEFILYMDYIYKLMTQPQFESKPPSVIAKAKTPYQTLPHARPGAIAGLLELVHEGGGKEDIYRIAEELRLDLDDLLPIIEAAVLLSFAKTERGDVEITPEGRAFAGAGIASRKELFREAALAHVNLLRQMRSALTSKSDHAMPLEFFRNILEEHFPDNEVQRQIDTALNWGRSGDLFNYDSESDRLVLTDLTADNFS